MAGPTVLWQLQAASMDDSSHSPQRTRLAGRSRTPPPLSISPTCLALASPCSPSSPAPVMSIGFLSFAVKALTSDRSKETPPIVNLHPTTHDAHHLAGLTPTSIQCVSSAATLFDAEFPGRLRSLTSKASTSSQIASHTPYHVVQCDNPILALDIQQDEDQGESLCLSATEGVVSQLRQPSQTFH